MLLVTSCSSLVMSSPLVVGPVIGAGREIKILAVAIECRVARIAHAVGHLRALAALQRIHDRSRAAGSAAILAYAIHFESRRPGEVAAELVR